MSPNPATVSATELFNSDASPKGTSSASPIDMSVGSILNPEHDLPGTVAQELSSSSAALPSNLWLIMALTVYPDLQDHIQQTDQGDASGRNISSAPSTGDAPATEVDIKTEDVEEAGSTQIDSPEAGTFKCMNDEFDECQTGQISASLSRKVISDHFGRNKVRFVGTVLQTMSLTYIKACTRLITDWPLFCRKHYQRATYNQKLWQARKVLLIVRQFGIIEAQFPGTKYTVVLKKSEEQRLNTFSRKLAAGVDEATAAALVASQPGKHFEAPVNVLREIEQLGCLGEDKSKADVEATVDSLRDMLETGETDQIPSIEFLPQIDQNGGPYIAQDRKKTPKKSTSRISAKGSVTKPSSTPKTPRASRTPRTPKKSTSNA